MTQNLRPRSLASTSSPAAGAKRYAPEFASPLRQVINADAHAPQTPRPSLLDGDLSMDKLGAMLTQLGRAQLAMQPIVGANPIAPSLAKETMRRRPRPSIVARKLAKPLSLQETVVSNNAAKSLLARQNGKGGAIAGLTKAEQAGLEHFFANEDGGRHLF